ncbi:hypothetical protein FHG87_006513 [Trinorchestia longiramus]|nr:hypothetical protein FHG87_006513 [Trinorchestia longiramus]
MELLIHVITATLLVSSSEGLPQTPDRPETSPGQTQVSGFQPSNSNEDRVTEREDYSISTTSPILDLEQLSGMFLNSDLDKNFHFENSQSTYPSFTTEMNGQEPENASETIIQPLTENSLVIEHMNLEFLPNSGEQTSTVTYESWNMDRTDTPGNEVMNEKRENTDQQLSRRPKLHRSKEAEDLPGDVEPTEKSDAMELTSKENRSSNTSAQGRSHVYREHHHKSHHPNHRSHHHDYHSRYDHDYRRRSQHKHKNRRHRNKYHQNDSRYHSEHNIDHVHIHDHNHEYPPACSAYPPPPEKHYSKPEHDGYSDHGHHSDYHGHHSSFHDEHYSRGKYKFLDRHGHPDKAHSLYHRQNHYEHYHNDHPGGHGHNSHPRKHNYHRHPKGHDHRDRHKDHDHHGKHRGHDHRGHHKGYDHHEEHKSYEDHDHHGCYDCHHEHPHHHDRRRRHREHHHKDDGSWSFGNFFKLPMIGHKITLGISGGLKKRHHR